MLVISCDAKCLAQRKSAKMSHGLLSVRVVDSYSQGAAGTVSTESNEDEPQRVHITTKSKLGEEAIDTCL